MYARKNGITVIILNLDCSYVYQPTGKYLLIIEIYTKYMEASEPNSSYILNGVNSLRFGGLQILYEKEKKYYSYYYSYIY